KDASGVRAVLGRGGIPADVTEAVVQLTTLAGDASVLAEASRALSFCAAAREAVEELAGVVSTLREAGLGAHPAGGLGGGRGLDYYTGLVFRIYAPGLGFEVGGGGRYDALLGRFGRPMPAVGFMLGLDRVALLLERQGQPGVPRPDAEAVAGAGLGTA